MAIRNLTKITPEQGAELKAGVMGEQKNFGHKLVEMLKSLKGNYGGFAVDQLEHNLQLATRLERAGFPGEVVFIGLFHDVAKAVSWLNHAAIGAEMLKPYLSEDGYWLQKYHQEFQARSYGQYVGGDPERYLVHKDHRMFDTAMKFSDLDLVSFDPEYKSFGLEHFLPLIEKICSNPSGKK